MDPVIEFTMQTPDGAWRVEVVRRARTRWYRIVHGDNEIDWLAIGTVQRILREAGVDMADLEEVVQRPLDDPGSGVA